jgi:hypothetical protein
MSLKRHWPTILAVVSNLPAIWRGIVWLFDWEVRIESFLAQFRQLGGFAVVIQFLLNPPPWLIWITLPIGLLLIWWDARRPHTTKIKATDIAEARAFYNSWLLPTAQKVEQVLRRIMNAMRRSSNEAIRSQEGLIQRSIADEERAALSSLSNAIRGIEPTNDEDLQNRIGRYYGAYQSCRTWIAKGLELTGVDLRSDSIFQEWMRLDEKFLDHLRKFSGPSKYDRLRGIIEGVGWGENIIRDLRDIP